MTIKEFVEKWQPLLTHWSGATENPQFVGSCQALWDVKGEKKRKS